MLAERLSFKFIQLCEAPVRCLATRRDCAFLPEHSLFSLRNAFLQLEATLMRAISIWNIINLKLTRPWIQIHLR